MLEMLQATLTYLGRLLALIRVALLPDPALYRELAQYGSQALPLTLGVVFVAGVSLLIGQSVILFLNHVPPWRFLLSLGIHGLLLVVSVLITGSVIWVAGQALFVVQPPLIAALAVVGLSYAPLAFGFLILIPYLGTLIEKLLYGWSALILVVIVRYGFETDLATAVLCVGLAYLLRTLLAQTLGRPLIALRRWVLRRVVGTADLDLTPAEIRAQVSAGLNEPGGGPQ